ncbi:hypothetical protein D3C80_1220750 [compost metagenome]
MSTLSLAAFLLPIALGTKGGDVNSAINVSVIICSLTVSTNASFFGVSVANGAEGIVF